MHQALTIAYYFLLKSQKENLPVTPKKLQKLVYFAPGWHLAMNGTALVDETIEAWPYGPVVPSVYHHFKKFGTEQISAYKLLSNKGFIFSNRWRRRADQLTESTKETLDFVWDLYKGYSGIDLSALTHAGESPWGKVLKMYDGIPHSIPISNDLIEDYFKSEFGV